MGLSLPARAFIIFVAATVLCGLSWSAGWRMRGDRERAALLDQAVAYAREVAARQADNDQLSADLERARSIRAPKDRIITKDVIRYETLIAPADRCVLDGRWRLLHDAAATGEPADAAGLAAGAAEPVTDAQALEGVTDNYIGCRESIDKVRGWQRWWDEVGRKGKMNTCGDG